MSKRKRARVKSSIDQLPAATRERLEDMLSDVNNGMTYKDMADKIEADCGVRLSTSAIQRYAARYNRDAKQLKIVAEQMRQIERYMQEHSPADLSAYIAALIQNGLLRRLQDGQDEIDDLPIKDALKLSIQANRASAYVYRYRDQTIQRDALEDSMTDEEHINWLRSQLRQNPELLKEITEEIANGSAEMVCAAGDDGIGDGQPPQGG